MPEADFNKVVDEFIEEQNKHIGEIVIPRVGAHPRQPEAGTFGHIFHEYITTDTIRHYADAMGDKNPLFRSEDYAKGTVWGGIIAPPTFTDCIGASWAAVGRGFKRGEQKFRAPGEPSGAKRQFFQVIRPGDKFRIVDKYLGINERKSKQERPYRLLIDTWKRTYLNQRDETVAIVDCYQAILAFPKDAPPAGPMYSGGTRKRRKLTDKERDAIYRGYEELKIRGSEVLWWEDVTVGEELKPLTVAPATTWDVAAFFASVAGECLGFDLLWEQLSMDRGSLTPDPETNFYRCGGEGHFADGLGLSVGATGGYAVPPGGLIDGLIGRTICNWMGDYGFLKMINTQFRGVPIQGEVWRIKGQVTGKSTDGDEHLVDLTLCCENLEGMSIVPATATVRLPSRT